MTLTAAQRTMLAALAALAVGLGVFQGTDLHPGVALGLAAATFAGVTLGLPARRPQAGRTLAPGVTAADLDRLGAEATAALDRLDAAIERLAPGDPARTRFVEIRALVRQIYEQLADDPADMPRAHSFRSAHVPAAVDLIETCARLSAARFLDAEARADLDRARGRLQTVQNAFVAQLNALMRHDLTALEAAGRHLEASLRLEHGLEIAAPGGGDGPPRHPDRKQPVRPAR